MRNLSRENSIVLWKRMVVQIQISKDSVMMKMLLQSCHFTWKGGNWTVHWHYQSILRQQNKAAHDIINSAMYWTHTYKIMYTRVVKSKLSYPEHSDNESWCFSFSRRASLYNHIPFFPGMFVSEIELERSSPTYDILYLLKILEGINRFRFHLISRERERAFGEGREDNLAKLNVVVSNVPQNEFVSSKLTEKLKWLMRDPLVVSVGAMPSWCTQLMTYCPFIWFRSQIEELSSGCFRLISS